MKIPLTCPSVRYYNIEIRSEAFTDTDEQEATLRARGNFIEEQYRINDVLDALYACEGGCLLRVAHAAPDDVRPSDGEVVSELVGTNPQKYKVHVVGKRPLVVACLDPEAFPTGHRGDEGKIDAHMAQLVKGAQTGHDGDGKPVILETGRTLSCPGEQELTVSVFASGWSDTSAADAKTVWQRHFSDEKRALELTLERFFSCEQGEGSKCAAKPLVTESDQGPVTLKEGQEEETKNGHKVITRWSAAATVEVTFLVKCKPK